MKLIGVAWGGAGGGVVWGVGAGDRDPRYSAHSCQLILMNKYEYTLLATGKEYFVCLTLIGFLQIWYGYNIIWNAKQFLSLEN